MKIIVRTKGKKLRLWLPGSLLYGRISARIAIAAITKYAPDCGIPPEMLGQLLASLRDFARTHPGWLLVDITTHHKTQGAAPTPCGDSSFF